MSAVGGLQFLQSPCLYSTDIDPNLFLVESNNFQLPNYDPFLSVDTNISPLSPSTNDCSSVSSAGDSPRQEERILCDLTAMEHPNTLPQTNLLNQVSVLTSPLIANSTITVPTLPTTSTQQPLMPVPVSIPVARNNFSTKKEPAITIATPITTPVPATSPTGTVTTASSNVDAHTLRELLKEQDIKKARLARKAELARMSRKRKKMRLNDLEGEVTRLKEELERERKQRRVAEDSLKRAQQVVQDSLTLNASGMSDQVLNEESKQLHDALRSVSNAPFVTQTEITSVISSLLKVFEKKHARTCEQLKTTKKSLATAMPLRFLEWAMNQSDKFYADPNGLWNSLFLREVGLTEDQLNKMMQLREAVRVQRVSSTVVEEAYQKLVSAVQANAIQSNANLEQLMNIFTPEQLAKYMSWVDTYGSVCVQINL